MKFGSKTNGMGDILLLTGICKYFPNKFIIQIPKDQERFSIFFDKLAEVEISNEINYLDDIGDGHYTTRKLRNFFGDDADSLDIRPQVLYNNIEDDKWAEDYIKDKTNPVIVVPTCSKSWAELRNVPKDLMDMVIKSLVADGKTPIICQSSLNKYSYTEYNSIVDLDISKYISLLKICGNYVGANTGDMHLAIGLGLDCTIIQPKPCTIFNPEEWCYKNEKIKYIEF
jgi:hypothetical protein